MDDKCTQESGGLPRQLICFVSIILNIEVSRRIFSLVRCFPVTARVGVQSPQLVDACTINVIS